MGWMIMSYVILIDLTGLEFTIEMWYITPTVNFLDQVNLIDNYGSSGSNRWGIYLGGTNHAYTGKI